ncbi:MAG: glycosyltransferase [Patescibacteria group bacterium]
MSNNKQLSFSICLPTYKGSHVLGLALDSIFKQSFQNYEIIISDDTPPEFKSEILKTQKLIKSYKDKRIQYFKNSKNLGYPLNLRKIVAKAKNDVIFLLAQDDILSLTSLQETHAAFLLSPEVKAVTRPYFWYQDDINHPVRVVKPYDEKQDAVLSVFGTEDEFVKIFESLGQLSGLAYMRNCLTIPFNEEIFPAHIYPFAGILKKHKCVFLHNYTVAVGIKDSQTRSLSSIYDQSPTASWLKMYQTVFAGEKFAKQRIWGIKHMSTHFEGLVQIKNYGSYKYLLREIMVLLQSRWQNIFEVRFWFYTLLTLFIPKKILIAITDWYKTKVMSQSLPKINFEL